MKASRWIICLILFFTALVGAQPAAKKLKVVVYSLDAQGVDKSVTETLTGLITDELSQSDKIDVRDEKTTIAILKEQGLAQSGHCSAETCRIDNAKLIKADLIVLGSVGNMGSGLYVISIRVADVNGTTVYPQKQMCKNCTNEEMISIVEQMARNIRTYLETGKKVEPPKPIEVGDTGTTTTTPPSSTGPVTTPPPTQAGATGSLEIRTNPPGARIFIDSEEVGISNKTVQVSAGEHEVTLVKDGYADVSQKVTVPPGRTVILTKTLTVQVGEIEVTVNVAGATIYLDGRQMGTSTAGRGSKIANVGVGNHKIKVVHPSYETQEQDISVAPNQSNPVTINLTGKPGKVLITSTPGGAAVSIGGASKGKTPLSISLEPGSYSAEVSLDGYETAQQDFQVEAGKSGTVKVILKKIQQAITPSASTGGARGDMVHVPAGEFTMGSDSGGNDEKPVHRVYLDAFHIDKYDVTNAQYEKCVSAGSCNANYKYNGFTEPQQPVVGVDWNQANAYCKWAGKRLPTEAQWEKAARGTDGRKYPWGNQEPTCSYAIMSDGGNGCGKNSTWVVGSKPAGTSPYGAMDMAGNVWQWVADWYDGNYYKNSPSRNPTGPTSGSVRVIRGGCWTDFAYNLRATYRFDFFPSAQSGGIGFRCVRD